MSVLCVIKGLALVDYGFHGFFVPAGKKLPVPEVPERALYNRVVLPHQLYGCCGIFLCGFLRRTQFPEGGAAAVQYFAQG